MSRGSVRFLILVLGCLVIAPLAAIPLAEISSAVIGHGFGHWYLGEIKFVSGICFGWWIYGNRQGANSGG